MDYDVCLIQEPYIDFKGKMRANAHWSVVYPETHSTNPKATCSLILINARLKSDSWIHLPFNSPDIMPIQLVGEFGTLRIFNIYNDCNHNDSLTHLSSFLRDPQNRTCTRAPLHNMWMGDFNRHHPLWDEPRNEHLFTRRNLDLTQLLLDMIGRHNMKMALPPGIATLQALNTRNHTRVDNVFCSEDILDNITQCDVGDSRPQKSDHYPIITTLDIGPPIKEFAPRHNFCMTKWPEFLKLLKENIDELPEPEELRTCESFEEWRTALNEAIQNAIDKHVPLSKPSPFTKRWWTSDLAAAKKVTKKLASSSKRYRPNMEHPIHKQYRRQHNDYSEMIRTAKIEHWAAWLEGLDESSIWTASRLVTGPDTDGGQTRVPTLQVKDPVTKQVVHEAADNESKGKLFFKTFFPTRPAVSSVPPNPKYPPPKWEFQNITNEQIDRSIKKMKPYKATCSGTVPNCVFTHAQEMLVPHLGPYIVPPTI